MFDDREKKQVKRFAWRLQRLLDIKIKEEDVKRSELITVTEQAVAVRGQIMLGKANLRRMLAELKDHKGTKRVTQQELFLQYTYVFDRKIEELENRLTELEKLRRMKIREILEIRKLRKGLEKLRVKAKTEFMQQQEKREQNELDDNTTIRFARDILQKV